jgi:hypothetical protein
MQQSQSALQPPPAKTSARHFDEAKFVLLMEKAKRHLLFPHAKENNVAGNKVESEK